MADWKVVARDTDVNGAPIMMRLAEFGKGRNKIMKWELYRNADKVGYAVNEADAKENFARVKNGATLNTGTGFYEFPDAAEAER
jgi:hypothetical protein